MPDIFVNVSSFTATLPGNSIQTFIASILDTQPGDYNQNGTVDAADYTVWRDTLGQNVTAGRGADGSGNGVVDQADYNTWKSNFGMMLGSGGGSLSSTSVVPEPDACCLMLFGAIAAFARRSARS